jgi:hypothetical protein
MVGGGEGDLYCGEGVHILYYGVGDAYICSNVLFESQCRYMKCAQHGNRLLPGSCEECGQYRRRG